MKKSHKTNSRSCYYHLTPTSNMGSILTRGLKCDEEGFIYLITDPNFLVFSHIALSQINAPECSLVEVCASGIKTEVLPDDVAEYGKGFQVRVKQGVIDSIAITHVADLKISRDFSPTAATVFGSNAAQRSLVGNLLEKEKAMLRQPPRKVRKSPPAD